MWPLGIFPQLPIMTGLCQDVPGTKPASKIFFHTPFLSGLSLHFIVSQAGPQIEIEPDA